MFFRKHLHLVGLLLFALQCSFINAQEPNDSIHSTTPFIKGRWVTGLSGSISSGSNSLNKSDGGMNINQYAIDFRTGQFVKDRLLVSALLSLSRTNISDFNTQTLESFYAGPMLSWYLIDDEQGSLFVSGAGVYSKFREESQSEINLDLQNIVDGMGGGMILRLGYSYVLSKKVAFDLSLNYSKMWLSADKSNKISPVVTKEKFSVNDLSFSFGFNVLLDSFFF